MIFRIVLAAAVGLIWLTQAHVTVWLGGCAITAVPAIIPVGVFTFLFAAALGAFCVHIRLHPGLFWKTA
jgi:hypothetical protein